MQRRTTLSFIDYVRENWIGIYNDAIRHIDLVLAAMALAVLIGVALGVLTYTGRRWPRSPRPPRPRS